MENEEVIRQQMEDTRTSLTEKLETLENRVVGTVTDATSAVSETVEAIKDSVQDTVGAVKDTVRDTVSSVKHTMHDGVEAVKDWFDVRTHFDNHPWLMFAGAVGVGFCLDRCFAASAQKASAPLMPLGPEVGGFAPRRQQNHPNGGHNGGHNGGGREKRRASQPGGVLHGVVEQFGPEINKLKGLALGALFGTLREIVHQAVPPQAGQQLNEIIDSATRKLGGEPLPASEWSGLESPVLQRRMS